MRGYGTKTKTKAVRMAMEDAVTSPDDRAGLRLRPGMRRHGRSSPGCPRPCHRTGDGSVSWLPDRRSPPPSHPRPRTVTCRRTAPRSQWRDRAGLAPASWPPSPRALIVATRRRGRDQGRPRSSPSATAEVSGEAGRTMRGPGGEVGGPVQRPYPPGGQVRPAREAGEQVRLPQGPFGCEAARQDAQARGVFGARAPGGQPSGLSSPRR